MLHTIQAELFQLIRSKLFWITEGLLFLLIFVSSFGEANFSLYVSKPSGQDEIVRQGWTGFQALNQVAHDFLPFVMIAVLVLTTSLLGRDLTKKLYKNTLASGLSRKEFYLFKTATLTTTSLIQLATVFVTAFILGSIFHGPGIMPKDFFENFSLSFFRSFVFIMACSSAFTCLLYLTYSTLASYLIFFVLIMLQASLHALFPQLNSDFFTFLILAGSLWGGYQAFQHRDL